MSDLTITIDDADLARALAVDLGPALQAASLAMASEAEDRIAPYPPAPSSAGRLRWYERGYGPRWRRRDGSIAGRQTSEMMNRRWSVAAWGGRGAALRNAASYSGRVQSQATQESIFRHIGWKTDQGVVDQIISDGTGARIAEQAARGALRGSAE